MIYNLYIEIDGVRFDERWKPIKGWEGCYEISDFGRVKSLERISIRRNGWSFTSSEKILTPICRKGYLSLKLSKPGVSKRYRINRLVGDAYVENINNYDEVNHIDCDKRNNFYKNLEWTNRKGNMEHAVKHKLMKSQRGELNGNSKYVLDLQTGIFYSAMSEAARAKGYGYKWLSKCLTGSIKNKTSCIYV